MRPRPPAMATLLDWVEGRLDDATAEQVALTVQIDPALQETVEWIRAFHAAAARMPLAAPPPEVSAALHAAFDRFHDPAGDGEWSEAHPEEADPALPHAAGFRSAGRPDVAHLAFRTSIGDLLLRVEPVGAGVVDIEGRVLLLRRWDNPAAGPTPGLDVAAMSAGTLRGATRCDSVRETFVLRGIPVDVDEIWVTHGAERVRAAVDLRGQ